jgi:hypothetical protein
VSTTVAADNVVLRVSLEEAHAIVEGLNMLLNCKRFSFKEPHEEVRQLHASLFETVERIEAAVASQTPSKNGAACGCDG